MMYVYIHSKNEEVYTVGFYSPDGKWHPESDWGTPEEAANRAHYLNGGQLTKTRSEKGENAQT